MGKLEIQDSPRMNKRFFNQGSSNDPRVNKGRVANPKPQAGKCGGSYIERSSCEKFGKKHEGKCLVSRDSCFSCMMSGHMKRDFPMLRAPGKEKKTSTRNWF